MIKLLCYGSDSDVVGIAIMASFTIAGDPIVEEVRCGHERRVSVVVALKTILNCRYMINRLCGADVTFMTQRTVAGIYARVVKPSISKVRGVMAIGAILGIGIGRYVIEEFTHTNPVVVTGVAAISDTGMIIGTGGKGAWGMTILAILGGDWHVGI